MTHDFTHERRVRVARAIPCTWCGEYIERKTPYYTWGQAFDGRLIRMNMHPECEGAYNTSVGMQDFMPGEFDRGVPCEA